MTRSGNSGQIKPMALDPANATRGLLLKAVMTTGQAPRQKLSGATSTKSGKLCHLVSTRINIGFGYGKNRTKKKTKKLKNPACRLVSLEHNRRNQAMQWLPDDKEHLLQLTSNVVEKQNRERKRGAPLVKGGAGVCVGGGGGEGGL